MLMIDHAQDEVLSALRKSGNKLQSYGSISAARLFGSRCRRQDAMQSQHVKARENCRRADAALLVSETASAALFKSQRVNTRLITLHLCFAQQTNQS
jgi:hypothetical protein